MFLFLFDCLFVQCLQLFVADVVAAGAVVAL